MINVDLISALWGVLGTTLLFVLGWAGKHTLDRLVLPRVLDWWARQTQQMALRRAEKLLSNFERDLKHASDLRHLILRVEDRTVFLIVYSAGLITLLLILILGFQQFPDEPRLSYGAIWSMLAIPGVYLSIFVMSQYSLKRDTRIFADLAKHRESIVDRLTKLLQAAGLDQQQIKTWLQKVPEVG